MSSLLRFSASALSVLLADHPDDLLPVVVDSTSTGSPDVLTFVDKLYRVMRSGLVGFTCATGVTGKAAGCGIGGWKDGGGCRYCESQFKVMSKVLLGFQNIPNPGLFLSRFFPW